MIKNRIAMEKLKSYSIENRLLSEKLTNWQLLFSETKQILRDYLIKVSKLHNFDYLAEIKPIDHLPSDCCSDITADIISLWYPFYYDLYRHVQEKIDYDIKVILFDIKIEFILG